MKLHKLTIIFAFSLLTLIGLSQADSQTITSKLQGNTRDEVLKLLGEPNRSSSVPSGGNSSSSETLYYGDSQVTLINNKVSSIFDMGDIKDILNKKNSRNLIGRHWINWPNPWTSPQSLIKKDL